LADEEVRVPEARLDDVGEEPAVGGRPGAQLGEDGGPAQPAVVLAGPPPQGVRRGRVGAEHGADEVGGGLVHEVPPGAGNDEVPVEGSDCSARACAGTLRATP